jgi:hypothetical protein
MYVVVVLGDTVMLDDVAPLLHAYVLPPLTVSVVLSPLQMTLSPVIAGVGNALTVTVILVFAWQPLASVAVTVYVVVVLGVTVMLAAVDPLLHV